MRRDLDLIRKMLLAIEDSSVGYAREDLAGYGYSQDQISDHAYLLIDAGLAVGDIGTDSGSTGPEAMIRHLARSGHEFAEAARDESRRQRAMRIVEEQNGSITVDLLKQPCGSRMRSAIGLA